jgi:thioesterase domain-containing protein/acyl carrier protein
MVGRPLGNAALYVLLPGGAVAPLGAPGELCLGGRSVARDYLGRPGLTAERFVPDPFSAVPGARLYRTGDRVRWLPTGALEFLGRTDRQVKVRGFRIEPGEIEARLVEHPGVREAVVVAREAAPDETRLVAYVAGEEEALTAGALRSSLERTLPAHMIPSVFVRLEELPLLPNGKVDRAALPAPASSAWRDGQGYVAPSSATERVLIEIWESLLDVRPIGVDDHFFRLGGHSMLAVRLMTQIRRRHGVEVPLAALFEHPTVRGLATRMEGEPRTRPWSPLVAIQPQGDRVPIFFVHPVGGEVLCYSDLARELGPEQPFYGLQTGELVHLGEDEASIEEMAARYVAAIREVRPKGPYLLGGWSFGGVVAFEMAQQLTRAGESVPLVTMLDTRSPGERRPADLDPCIRLAGMARAEALAVGKEISLTADDLRPLDPDARIARTVEVLRAAGVVPDEVEVGWGAAFLRGLDVRMRSALRYEPKLYPGRIAMFVPSERAAGPELSPLRDGGSSPGWEAYVSEPVLKQTVPGHHDNMVLGENAAALARHLRAVMEESLLTAHMRW